MSDIYNKTPENICPTPKKTFRMMYPRTDIFNTIQQDIPQKGKRLGSVESVRNDGNYCGKRPRQMNEIHFANINKEKYLHIFFLFFYFYF